MNQQASPPPRAITKHTASQQQQSLSLYQGDEALQQWEAWNEMVASHLEKQHNPTMHAIRHAGAQLGGAGNALSRSSSVLGGGTGGSLDRHGSISSVFRSGSTETGIAASDAAAAAPHFYVPTTSSFRKHQREAVSTPKSRAELFRSAHSPSGAPFRMERDATNVDPQQSGAPSGASVERRRSLPTPPSADESLPEALDVPTELTCGNYLVASSPNPLILLGLHHTTAERPTAQQTIDEASAPGSTASGTPRSARMDSQRLSRLRQVRLDKKATTASEGPGTAVGSPTRAPTLEDLASGSFEVANASDTTVITPAQILVLPPAEPTTNDAGLAVSNAVLEPPSPQEQPVVSALLIPELNATPVPLLDDDPQEPRVTTEDDDDILSSLRSDEETESDDANAPLDDHEENNTVHGIEEGTARPMEGLDDTIDSDLRDGDADAAHDEEDFDDGELFDQRSSSSADVVPASSADEVALLLRRSATSEHRVVPSTSTAAAAASSRKRSTVEQMPYRKKKELIEKVRTRQQQQSAANGPPQALADGKDAGRSDGGAANASQSNADADVSKDDETSRVRQLREKKVLSGRRRTGSAAGSPPPLPPAAQGSPTAVSTEEPDAELQPVTEVLQLHEAQHHHHHDVSDISDVNDATAVGPLPSAPRRSIGQLPRPRRKSFASELSSVASDTDSHGAPSPPPLHQDTDEFDSSHTNSTDAVAEFTSPPRTDSGVPPTATANTVAQSDVPVEQLEEDTDDDLDAVIQSVIRERSQALAPTQESEPEEEANNRQNQHVEWDRERAAAREREENASHLVHELEMNVEALQRQLETSQQQAEAHHARVLRLEHQQSSLLVALGRCSDAAEAAEEEDSLRRDYCVDEQREWDQLIMHPFHEYQLCLEVERYEGMMEAQATSHANAWAQQSEVLCQQIATLEEQLREAFEQHEADVDARETAFDDERVELVRVHMDTVQQQREAHDAEVVRLVAEHTQRFDAMISSFVGQIDALSNDHRRELASSTETFEGQLADAEALKRTVVSRVQSHGGSLAESLWVSLRQQQLQGTLREHFLRWEAVARGAMHRKITASLTEEHATRVSAIHEQNEQRRAEAADEYEMLSQLHNATLLHGEAVQSDLDVTRDTLQALHADHNVLMSQHDELNAVHDRNLEVCQSLTNRVELLEGLVLKAEDHVIELRKELYAQEAICVAMKAVQEQSDQKAERLTLQRLQLMHHLDELRGTARLRAPWSLWKEHATKTLLRRGTVAVRQNHEAREELQSWREFLLTANSPKGKAQSVRSTPANSSRTASHVSVTSMPLHRNSSRAPSVVGDGAEFATKDFCELLPGEDDMSVSLKYLLSRERTEVAAVKSSLVKHRTMLAEGNAAMERMILEMEILSKQNKELVSICHRQRIDVPRALQSGEVPTLVQRLLDEEASQRSEPLRHNQPASVPLQQQWPPAPSSAKRDRDSREGKTNHHVFTRSEGDEDGYVVD